MIQGTRVASVARQNRPGGFAMWGWCLPGGAGTCAGAVGRAGRISPRTPRPGEAPVSARFSAYASGIPTQHVRISTTRWVAAVMRWQLHAMRVSM